MKNSIFTKEEALISCSSLNSLDLSSFGKQETANKFFITENDVKIIIKNILNCINKMSDRIANLAAKNNKDLNSSNLILNVLMNRRYRRGSHESNNPDLIIKKCKKKIKEQKPIELNVSLFPCKIPNGLKCDGELPDLAEIISIARLKEISMAVEKVYSPGLNFVVLLDGLRFENICYFKKDIIRNYQNKVFEFLNLINNNNRIIFLDYVGLLKNKLSSDTISLLEKTKANFVHYYYKKMGLIIDVKNPKKYLAELRKTNNVDVKKIVDLFYSLIYSINFPEAYENKSDDFVKKIYEDPFNTNINNKIIRQLRIKLLEKTWNCCINYAAEISAGRVVKPTELIYPNSIKCDMHMIPERYTFYSVDRSSPLTAFHGSGYINEDGIMGVKFRCQLINAGYQPVCVKGSKKYPYEDQAFFYVPKTIKNIKMLKDLIKRSKIRT